jgi:low temperature requirement protein LtrA
MIRVLSTTKNLESSHEQGADFVELFFDLVFVYAITRITAVTAHHLDLEHVLQSVLVFWLIWWGWTQFT